MIHRKSLSCTFALVVALIAVRLPAAEPQALTAADLAGKRVLILGDSITQNGRYVSFFEYYLNKNHPDKAFDIVSIGLASETASGLSEPGHPFPRPCVHERLGRALAKVKPQVVIACYGMNDGIYHPQCPERMKAFQDGVTRLIDTAKQQGVGRIVLVTPPIFDAKAFGDRVMRKGDAWVYFRPYAEYDGVLGEYADWLKSLKVKDVTTIDLHGTMAAALAEKRKADPNYRLSRDGIHPGELGHLIMARALLAGLGEKMPSGTADEELQRAVNDPLLRLVHERRVLRSKDWLPYVGYTRGGTFHRDSIEDTEKAAEELRKKIDAARRP